MRLEALDGVAERGLGDAELGSGAREASLLGNGREPGEGGTLSLLALAQRAVGRRTPLLLGLGVAGAALFYGDAAITPAISVLSAVEGLQLIAPTLEPYVLPVAVTILAGLFWVQSGGTGRVSALFGPVTLVWFLTLAGLGLLHAFDRPDIFLAFDPRQAIGFVASHGLGSLPVMGSVFLAVTGAEALYADMVRAPR